MTNMTGPNPKNFRRLMVMFALAALVLAACSSSATNATTFDSAERELPVGFDAQTPALHDPSNVEPWTPSPVVEPVAEDADDRDAIQQRNSV